MRNTLKILPFVLLLVMLIGCSGGVNENKPVSDIIKEAQNMSVEQLKSMVSKYESAITAKKADIEKVAAKIKEIPLKDILGDEARKLKTDIESLNKSIKDLTERMNVYIKQLSEQVKRG